MLTKIFIAFVTLGIVASASANQTPAKDKLSIINSPFVKGDTLYIVGRIDSHIYDYLAWEEKALSHIKTISLNSWGGSHDQGLEIGRKIREMKKNTIVEEGSVCASACVYVFAGGVERMAHPDTWFGIHGARLGMGSLTEFWGTCFIELEQGYQYVETLKGCAALVDRLYKLSAENTEKAFDKIQGWGTSAQLFQDYKAMQDQEDWYNYSNFYKKPDWELPTSEAMQYNLVTHQLTD